jgi:very-short-patch-repair endonuclease
MLMKVKASPVTKARSQELRRDMTDAERKLWSVLSARQLGGVKFRRQVPLGPYIADFASHEAKLIIEIDGGQHAENRSHEDVRSAFLRDEGYQVLRFWNNDVLGNLEGVHAIIVAAIGELPHAADA